LTHYSQNAEAAASINLSASAVKPRPLTVIGKRGFFEKSGLIVYEKVQARFGAL
jgi:hypothetical protein